MPDSFLNEKNGVNQESAKNNINNKQCFALFYNRGVPEKFGTTRNPSAIVLC